MWVLSVFLFAECQVGAFWYVEFDNDFTRQDEFESLIGKQLAITMFFINFDTDFPTTWCNTIYSNHQTMPMITWEPYTGSDSSVSILDDILNGSYDSYITNFATDAKNWGHPVLLRWGHEMNADWYGWSGDKNGGDSQQDTSDIDGDGNTSEAIGPAKYVAAYKYVWNKFKEVGADNVYWVWCPNSKSFPAESWNLAINYYPGDQYVDWVGIDGYNTGDDTSSQDPVAGYGWKSFDEVFWNMYSYLDSAIPDKPFLIGEMASDEDDDDNTRKASWITDAFSSMKQNYPRIKAFIWFHKYKEHEWQVDSSTNSLNAFKNAMADSYYVSVANPTPTLSSSGGTSGTGEGEGDSASGLVGVYPSVVSPGTKVKISMPVSGEVMAEVVVMDSRMRVAKVVYFGSLSSGTHEFEWLPASSEPGGLYFVLVKIEGNLLAVRKVIYLK